MNAVNFANISDVDFSTVDKQEWRTTLASLHTCLTN